MIRFVHLHRWSMRCLLLAALAFVLQPLAHAEHRLLMAFPELGACPSESAAHGAHDDHDHHAHADHAQHDLTPMPICCDCTCCKLSETVAEPTSGLPPTLAAAQSAMPAPSRNEPLPPDPSFLRPPSQASPLS
ncbi:hypothetical protein M0534_02305 [Methylonatrum kenyense]|uniref:hypothetical protein n=1 Tax=Methylonatrum kenyense TaxID=455253 RepID=UPI0020BEA0D6|nr:hypothetical protein [Methylonatrum kenyense]MCK8515167.1 hypothetical protein [Methylonatrum kenyense]